MDNNAIHRLRKNASPPNTAGKSAARRASGPMMTKVGMTAQVGVGDSAGGRGSSRADFSQVDSAGASPSRRILDLRSSIFDPRSSFFTSGPRPGGSLGSGSGGAFLPARP